MFKNYLRTALRNLQKNKTYSFLNIFGLAAGIACAGLILLWVEDELSYDNMYPKKELLYQVMNNQTFSGAVRTFDDTPGPLAEAMKSGIPGVANTCRITWSTSLFSLGNKSVYENGLLGEPSLFDMLSLTFTEGNAKDAFRQLNSIVITEKMAKHFFGNEQKVAGRILKMDNSQNYTVTGVIRDLPDNSTMRFEWAIPFAVYLKDNDWLRLWGANSLTTLAELSPSADPVAVGRQLKGLIKKNDPTANAEPILLAMKDWHLRDQFTDGKQSGGRIEYVRLFTLIACIILLIACINFMNLATARSGKRAREVGVRKVLGAGRPLLILQFVAEALFLAALSVVLGVLLISMALPLFNILVQKQLILGLQKPLHLLALLIVTLVCGIIAGSYPAFYLSSFNPIYVFKGIRIKGGTASLTRKGLVVLQFTISIILIISTIVVYRQVQHIKDRNLGYDRNNLMDIPVTGNMVKDYPVIRQDLLNTGIVESTALAKVETIYTSYNTTDFNWEGKNPSGKILISVREISPGYIRTLGMQLVEGRDFKEDVTVDSTHVLVTEAMARLMGIGSPLGKGLQYGKNSFTVVGVVKDYVYGDMYGQPDPVVFFSQPSEARFLYVRTNPGVQPEEALEKIGAVLRRDNPVYPFTYNFVDDQFNARFTAETLIGKLSRIFSFLAIFISCLGLFGLASFTAEQRTREIGIRKVLGASVKGIMGLLSWEFMKLVLVSNLIAFPAAWWLMNHWLEGYAYHVAISWWIFPLAGILSMLIAIATISFQSVRAGLSNPVSSLRSE